MRMLMIKWVHQIVQIAYLCDGCFGENVTCQRLGEICSFGLLPMYDIVLGLFVARFWCIWWVMRSDILWRFLLKPNPITKHHLRLCCYNFKKTNRITCVTKHFICLCCNSIKIDLTTPSPNIVFAFGAIIFEKLAQITPITKHSRY